MVSVYEGTNGASEALLAGSTIDDAYNTRPFSFQTNSWYRLVLNAPPNQGVRAAVLDDNGVELTGASFAHGASAFSSGFKIVLSQFGAASGAASTNTSPVDVALDYARLTTGQSGEVNQAFYGDGVATRMIVPRCPELDLGLGRGFSIEGWINPSPASVIGATNMSDGFENVTPQFVIPAGSYVSGWHVDAGNIDVLTTVANNVVPDSGTNFIDINGTVPGTISTNLSLVVGQTYQLSFAYCRNADSVAAGIVPQAVIRVAASNLLTVTASWSNTWSNPQWHRASLVFTASSALSKLQVQGLNPGGYGVMFDTFNVTELITPPSPLVEWNDPTNLS